MNLRKHLILAAAATSLVIGSALPASAAPTDTSFALTGGSLTLSVEATATLTEAASGTTAISGSLGAVSVTDARGGTANWIASAGSSDFIGALTTPSTSTAVSYTAGVVTETGTITVADGATTVMGVTEASVVAPSSLSGNNTAAWAPVLDVTMPAGALADTYSGLVTTSVL